MHPTVLEWDQHPILDWIFANCLCSAVLSCWLIAVCSSGNRRLLKRQLRHQALANLLISLMKVGEMAPCLLWEVKCLCMGKPDIDVARYVVPRIIHGLYVTCGLVEVHIALTFVAAARRSSRYLNLLSTLLPFVWLAALGIVLLLELVFQISGHVSPGKEFDDPLAGGILALTFVVTIACYINGIGCLRRDNSPSVAVRRSIKRVVAYPLIFFATTLPVCIRFLGATAVCTPGDLLAVGCEHVYGFLNAIAYAVINQGKCCCCLDPPVPILPRGTSVGGSNNSSARLAPVATLTTARSSSGTGAAGVVGFDNVVQQTAISYGSWRLPFQWARNSYESDGSEQIEGINMRVPLGEEDAPSERSGSMEETNGQPNRSLESDLAAAEHSSEQAKIQLDAEDIWASWSG